MQWREFNDLVGKDRAWGEFRGCTKWQQAIYARANGMFRRCNNPADRAYKWYGGIGIKCEFTSLSEYYSALKKDPLWPQFKRHPERYDIDKDIKRGHGSNYSLSTIKIVTKADNKIESNYRNRSYDRLGEERKRRVELDGVVYNSVKEAEAASGLCKSSISHHAEARTITNTVRGKKYTYTCSNTWTDKQGQQHTARYI